VRQTIVIQGRLALRRARLEAARAGRHGLQAMSVEALAARLAGGLLEPIDPEALRRPLQVALAERDLGELEAIKTLPGMVEAGADSLARAWRAGISLGNRGAENPRIAALAALEQGVLAALPPAMLRPADLVARALGRLDHAAAVLGPVSFAEAGDLAPCWRPLVLALAAHTPVQWLAGPRPVPAWLDGSPVSVERTEAQTPAVASVSAANTLHEAVEALRWARELVASGRARPQEIAIAACDVSGYDDHLLALRADSLLPLAFCHGVKVAATGDGQTTAALADILLRGLSQSRVRRLAGLLGTGPGPFASLPDGWMRLLPADASLTSESEWRRLLGGIATDAWPGGVDRSPDLLAIVGLLAGGTAAAEAAGEGLLAGRALAIWRKALAAGAPAALDATLGAMRQDDEVDADAAIVWAPAAALAAAPRRFVRLLGLTSSGWPRRLAEDRLLPDHVIPARELESTPRPAADRRDFAAILATTDTEVVLSRPRRDGEGRLLGRSPLLREQGAETYLRRNRRPSHAFSETDRLMARPDEFGESVQGRAALDAWQDWARREITAHDGLVRPNHPAIVAILGRVQSASSLARLLRDPLGFTWRYAFRLEAPRAGPEQLMLDPAAFGDLLHQILDRAVGRLEQAAGLGQSDVTAVSAAVTEAADEVAARWEQTRGAPPPVVWRRTLQQAIGLAEAALTFQPDPLPDQASFAEVPFGGQAAKHDEPGPWDPELAVEVPGAGLRISGYIDRLDLSGDRSRARVWDYKSGRTPAPPLILSGGRELQRCLYGFATRAILGGEVAIEATLLYPREPLAFPLENLDGTLAVLAEALVAARASLLAGNALPGPDSGGDWDDLAFALPANAANTYALRKAAATAALLGEATRIWEMD
jgi:hypothetical protein